MSYVSPEFVERYQKLYERDPDSKVFAPLGEAYRKMGLLDAAFEICTRGVKRHPDFASGRVALAKVLLEKGSLREAVEQLAKACELAPENLLAHSLSGETWLKLRRPKEALSAYKMVLFLNPHDKKATEVVRKLESLTADEYPDDLFRFLSKPSEASFIANQGKSAEDVSAQRPVLLMEEEPSPKSRRNPTHLVDRLRHLERFLSLADAFIVRNDTEKAMETLNRALAEIGPHPEIHSRLDLLLQRDHEREYDEPNAERREPIQPLVAPRAPRHPAESRGQATAKRLSPLERTERYLRKRQLLESFLQRINHRRWVDPSLLTRQDTST